MSGFTAFVFPGQGSQQVGMLADLAQHFALVQETFAEASEQLGFDLWQLTQQGPEEQLNQTANTQPALLSASVAIWRVWRSLAAPLPEWVAGHSLGEYSALVAAESIDFADAVRLVRTRGLLMQEAVPVGVGAMAAILGLEDAEVEAACAEAAGDEVVAAANYNAPGQVVIAGHRTAVERAIELMKARGAKRAMPLPVSVPSHCALMRPAAERLRGELASIQIRAPQIKVVQNVHAREEHQIEAIRANLVAQLDHPVRWTRSVETLAAAGVATTIECGPGKVLSGLNKRIDKRLNTFAIQESASLHEVATQLANGSIG